jgi:hypothetical protein
MANRATIKVPMTTSSAPVNNRSNADEPYVLSYFAQRRAAGYVGLALPLVVVVFDRFISASHCIPSSISASYYTGIRNFFIGSLCSVGIFLVSSIGYKRDVKYSIFAGVMAFLVALDPCRHLMQRRQDAVVFRYLSHTR